MATGDTLCQFWPVEQSRLEGGRTLPFTSGGTTAIVAGNTITGATSAATAAVVAVRLRSGSWAGGDAAGYLVIEGQSGTFQSENIDVGASTNLATIAGDSDENLSGLHFQDGRFLATLDSSAVEFLLFDAVLPSHYDGGGGTLTVNYQMGGANTSAAMVLDAFIMPVSDGDDLSVHAFADDGNEDTTTESVPNTADELDPATITIANAQMPSADQRFRLLLARDAAASADTANSTDARIDSIVLSET